MFSAGSVVKSVQRGRVTDGFVGPDSPINISISPVDSAKSVLVYYFTDSTGDTYRSYIDINLGNKEITITARPGFGALDAVLFEWQVIEFY